MIILRDYQQRLLDDSRAAFQNGSRALLLVAPTGAGKTRIFSKIAQAVSGKSKRILTLAHRSELIQQIHGAFSDEQIQHSIISPDYEFNPENPVQIGSVFSVINKLPLLPPPDLIIIDEAHHCVSDNSWGKIINYYKHHSRILGVTATPIRGVSGIGLGDVFDTMLCAPSTGELIRRGYLCPYKIYTPSKIDLTGVRSDNGDYALDDLELAANKTAITGDAIKHYRHYADGKPAVVFCVSRKHASDVAELFRQAGYRACNVDGAMSTTERDAAINGLTTGEIQVLTSCNLISEGVDIPRIEVAISLRPTKSLGLWMQQIGRALRLYPGKEYAIILDHADNTHNLKYSPDIDIEWSLDKRLKNKILEQLSQVNLKECPACYFCHTPMNICPDCGHEYIIESRELNNIDGELTELDKELFAAEQKKQVGRARSLEELKVIGKERGYHPKWAYVMYAKRKKRGS